MTRTSRRLLTAGVALALIAPLAGPAFAESAGLAAFTGQKCTMCHSVPQANLVAKVKSEKMKGPDLPTAREAEWMTGWIKHEIQVEGKNHKKAYKGTDEDLQAIVAWLIELEGAK